MEDLNVLQKEVGIYIAGHGYETASKVSPLLMDLIHSSITNFQDGFILSAIEEFGKLAYIFDYADKVRYRFDKDAQKVRSQAVDLCAILRKKSGSNIDRDKWFWFKCVSTYRYDAHEWERMQNRCV